MFKNIHLMSFPWRRKPLYCGEGGRLYRWLFERSFSCPVGLFFIPLPGKVRHK